MKAYELKASLRKEIGKKGAKKSRKQGNVPCVLYGGKEVIHFESFKNNFLKLIYSHEVFLVKLDIDGDKHDAIIKDIQFHPVTDEILHVDFLEVFPDKTAIMDIPVELTGSSIGLRNGGKLRLRRRSLKVKGLVQHFPETLDIDITEIDIGDNIKIGDLSFDNLEIIGPQRGMVVGVISSRAAAKGMEIEEPVTEEEEGAEGEEAAAAEEGAEAKAEGAAEEPKAEESNQ